MTRLVRLGAGAVLVAALAAGCGTPDGKGSASDGASSGATSTGTRAPASSPPASPAGADRCHTGDLKVSMKGLGAAAGNHYAAVVLTNTGGTSCRAFGYPGMQLLTGSGDKIKTSVVRDTTVKAALVTVPAGGSVWSTASWGAVPAGDESQTGQCEPTPASTEVTPPDETDYAVASWSFGPVCQHGRIKVTPVRAGSGPTK